MENEVSNMKKKRIYKCYLMLLIIYVNELPKVWGQEDTSNYTLTYSLAKDCYRTVYVSDKYYTKIIKYEDEGKNCKQEIAELYDHPMSKFLFSNSGGYWKRKRYSDAPLVRSIGWVYYHGPFHDDPVFLFEPGNDGVMSEEYTLWGGKIKVLGYTYLGNNPYYRVYRFAGYYKKHKRPSFEIFFCPKIGVIRYKYRYNKSLKQLLRKEKTSADINLVKVNGIFIDDYVKTNQCVSIGYENIDK